ncbi:6007_t:CDS:2 [Scutellospora calospora]|uniref:6007_t:CDS:1 n=1 Tax=Scutellospora calospora TaxID=85575 RepID=A0ACA9KVE8_9GLOM|nr:6007_t:CDS:2 [Scutellospora calospora]
MNKRPEQLRKKRMTMSLKTKQEICQRKRDIPFLTIDQLSAEYRSYKLTMMMPNQTLATKPVKGQKKVKDRVTVLLCMNATGTDKLKPLVIRKSVKPRCFKGIQKKNLGVEYDASQKAWMTGEVFKRWIKSLNTTCRLKKKKILLLVDGATSYSNCELTYVKLHFLLPNTTPYLQPCDAGIIYSFKSHYHKLFLQNAINAINSNKKIPHISLLNTIRFITEAWDSVTSQTIINCWKKTEIVPSNKWNHLSWNTMNNEFEVESEVRAEVEAEVEAEIEAEIEVKIEAEIEAKIAVENLIFEIPSDYMNVMSANDYIRIDNTLETEEIVLDEAAIIEEVLHKSDSSSSDEESNVEIEKIPHSVALEQCSLLIQYVEQQEPVKFVKNQDLPQLRSLLK